VYIYIGNCWTTLQDCLTTHIRLPNFVNKQLQSWQARVDETVVYVTWVKNDGAWMACCAADADDDVDDNVIYEERKERKRYV